MSGNYNSEDEAYYQKEQEAQLDQVIAQAVQAASKGENVEQLLEVMLSTVSGKLKDQVKKKFSAALKSKGLRQPTGEADVPSKSTLTRIRLTLALSAKQALDRVLLLVRARPDVANAVKQAGQILAENGVTVDKIQISEAELGNLTSVAVARSQTRGGDTGRGAS